MGNKNNYKEVYDNLKKNISEKTKEYKSNISAIVAGFITVGLGIFLYNTCVVYRNMICNSVADSLYLFVSIIAIVITVFSLSATLLLLLYTIYLKVFVKHVKNILDDKKMKVN